MSTRSMNFYTPSPNPTKVITGIRHCAFHSLNWIMMSNIQIYDHLNNSLTYTLCKKSIMTGKKSKKNGSLRIDPDCNR